MPGVDGVELARAIRARPALRATAIVLLTSSVTDIELAERAGVSHYLLKPARQSDLYNVISEALGEEAVAAPAPLEPPTVEPGDDGPLVLVAEDNEVNQLLATTMLGQRGVRTELARTGSEALAMHAERGYAAIFMDCQMPELDGYKATEQIRSEESGRRVPIIAMTANAMPADRERCLAAGMDDYLAKPIQPAQLERALGRWLPGFGDGRDEPAPEPVTGGLLDDEVITRIKADLDGSMRRRLMSTFEKSLRECVSGIEGAVDHGDRAELRRIAHLLKGSSATMGARRLRETCEALERAAVPDDAVRELGALAKSTRSALEAELLAA
jgi:CheY-like chemotaxis protein/HPt (histidine-containing phosphotransfer) domain-containing protein